MQTSPPAADRPDRPQLSLPAGSRDSVATSAGEVLRHRIRVRSVGGPGQGVAVCLAGTALSGQHLEVIAVRAEFGSDGEEADIVAVPGDRHAQLASLPAVPLAQPAMDFVTAMLAPDSERRARLHSLFDTEFELVVETLVLHPGAADLTIAIWPLDAPDHGPTTEHLSLRIARERCESGIHPRGHAPPSQVAEITGFLREARDLSQEPTLGGGGALDDALDDAARLK